MMPPFPASPLAALVPDGERLRYPPQSRPGLLVERMAAAFAVPAPCLLPVQGIARGLQHAARVLGARADIEREDWIEIEARPSRAPEVIAKKKAAVVRSLDAYGLIGAPCAAIIANPRLIERLESRLSPADIIPTSTVIMAERILDPSRFLAYEQRFKVIRHEIAQVKAAIIAHAQPECFAFGSGPVLTVPRETGAVFARLGVPHRVLPDGLGVAVLLGDPAITPLVLLALGLADAVPATARRAEVARDTKETRIVCAVNLDAAEPVAIQSGIPFFDHMLEQVARHGGFALTLGVAGDVAVDAHHSIEDASLALGEALARALGDRSGIARFGFTAPLDEALASVVVDLSGRPYAQFEGSFARPMIGAYPTELTAHVFRSLADSLRAAIHVRVTGSDDHHKTEAAFKALGRALRQAIAREGGGVPSTKGVL